MFSKSHWITEALTTAATLCIASLEYFITIITHHHHPFYIFDHKECLCILRSIQWVKKRLDDLYLSGIGTIIIIIIHNNNNNIIYMFVTAVIIWRLAWQHFLGLSYHPLINILHVDTPFYK